MRIKALFLLVLLVLTACSSSADKPAPASTAIPVLATKPIVRDVPVYVEALGTLKASVNVEVRPQVSGTISEVLVHEGDWVKVGSPLIKIEKASYEIKRQEAFAKLEMDKSTLSSSKRKLDRFKDLADKDLISKTEWDELETAVEKAAASVASDEASLKAADLDLSYSTIVACVEGRVGRLDVHQGQLVSQAQAVPLATISKMDPLLVEFFLTDKEVALLPKGKNNLKIGCIHTSAVLCQGEVSFLDNHFDGKSGLLLIRGRVPNPETKLRPGQNVRVSVLVNTIKNAKLLPQKAVKYNQDGAYLYVVGNDNDVQSRKVLLGSVQGDEVIVLEGVEEGELVITDGHMRIYPGSKVEVKE